MLKPEDISIIIPTLNATKEQDYALSRCLESLSDFKDRIVVATNGSRYSFKGDIQIQKQGQCRAVNAAVASTNTPWILVTNDDMIYPTDWFHRLQTIGSGFFVSVDLASEIYCVSPKLVEPRSGAPTFDVYFCGGAGGDFDKEKWEEYASKYYGNWYGSRSGFNLPFLIKRELWDLIGGYDIGYDPWSSNSDSDLEYKIRLAGVQPYQNQNCIVYHFSQTSGTFEPQNRPAWERNWQYFIEKWGFPRTDNGIWEATFDIPTKEQGRKFNPWWEGFYNK